MWKGLYLEAKGRLIYTNTPITFQNVAKRALYCPPKLYFSVKSFSFVLYSHLTLQQAAFKEIYTHMSQS